MKDFDLMLDSLSHRGPDGRGVRQLEHGRVVLGHRRLAIIDRTPAGAQPMTNENETIWLTLNGEIYNYRSLRSELLRLGHYFRSQSDSEVVIHAYEEWGSDCLRRLHGIFAFGLWDGVRKTLLLARDSMGVKPIYYARYADRFAFASQPKAIVGDPGFERNLSPTAFGSFLAFGYVPYDQAIFSGMSKLPAGHFAIFDGHKLTISCFCPDPELPYFSCSDQAFDAVDSGLRDAVAAQLVSDVPVGCFLSGGIDSSLLTALARQTLPDLRSFTVGFRESGSDEREFARAVADHFGTRHFESVLERPSVEPTLWSLQDYFDEPFDPNGPLPFLEVARLARLHDTVVALGGDGADELFAGYLRYDDFDQPPAATGPSALRRWLRQHGMTGARRTNSADLARYFRYEGCLSQVEQRMILSEDFCRELGDDEVTIMSRFYNTDLPAVEAAQRLDLRLYLTDHILCKVDRASMAHGVEARVPYLDPAVVSAALRVPLRFNYRNGERKSLFKAVASRYLPQRFVTSRKKGFSSPLGSWFDPSFTAWADSVIDGGYLLDTGVLRRDWRERLADATGHAVAGSRAASLLLTGELWARRWLDPNAASPLECAT